MKILVIGSGGREHALVWKIKQSPLVKKIYCAPGNAGIEDIAECVDISVDNINALIKFAKEKKIDLTVVGPEASLVAGIVDAFEAKDLNIFGPNQDAAHLEGSKIFAKEFMHECNIPTAPFKIFKDIEQAKSFVSKTQYPLVIKADGLASGKGVFICKNMKEANQALDQLMNEKIFKEAGVHVVIEECLIGEEVSLLAISDGEDYVILDSSQDHKRIFDGDLGPNTGGMGAYSPTAILTDDLLKKIDARIIGPTIRGLLRDGVPFKGVLYAGLMITSDGPMVLEYNVRFGDPETQAILPRLKTDIVKLMIASCEGRLSEVDLVWDKRHCVCVVMTSGGYPAKFETDKEIFGLNEASKLADTFVFHAGTKRVDKKILSAGGRVLGVTALGSSLDDAITRAYSAVEKITFERCFFRRDIGAKAMRKERLVSR